MSTTIQERVVLGSGMTPEAKAQVLIDSKLEAADWVVQDPKELNLGAGQGIAVGGDNPVLMGDAE